MFKTRNFTVVLGTISVCALSAAILYAAPDFFIGGQTAGVAFSDGTVDSFTATVTESQSQSLSREEKLAAMRQKIAARKNIVAVATPDQPTEAEEPDAVAPVTATEEVKREMRCSNYQTAGVSWSSVGAKIEEVEGARLVYKDGTPTMVGSTSVPTRITLAQLPLKSAPSSAGNCIATDVIGISKNGALMRNGEVLAYSGLGAGVLVGYALDGFPIYGGAHSGAVDVCGGATVGGQYRYFVGAGQDTVINCYSGSPISL
jgi:hypothetical protein